MRSGWEIIYQLPSEARESCLWKIPLWFSQVKIELDSEKQTLNHLPHKTPPLFPRLSFIPSLLPCPSTPLAELCSRLGMGAAVSPMGCCSCQEKPWGSFREYTAAFGWVLLVCSVDIWSHMLFSSSYWETLALLCSVRETAGESLLQRWEQPLLSSFLTLVFIEFFLTLVFNLLLSPGQCFALS